MSADLAATDRRESPPPRLAWLSRSVAVLVGVLLLLAAGMKLAGRDVSAVPPVGWLAAPWVQVAAAEWEIALGLWLLSGAARRGAWLAAVLTFVGFAGVSSYLGWQGVASCGCFGAIEASPWWAFGLDVTALTLLICGRPRAYEPTGLLPNILVICGLATVLLGIIAGMGVVVYGSVAAATSQLRGEYFLAEPNVLEFGDTIAGDRREVELRVSNLTAQPVRVVGGTSDCSCTTSASLPLTIPTGGSAPVVIALKVPQSVNSGQFTRRVELWTDCDLQRVIRLTLSSRVKQPGE